MKIHFLLAGALLLLPPTGFCKAELPATAYAAMQSGAQEHLTIEVLTAKATISGQATFIDAQAKVLSAMRSASSLTVGAQIRIQYWINHSPRPGGSSPPVLQAGARTQAYLNAVGDSFGPAAGGKSFAPVDP